MALGGCKTGLEKDYRASYQTVPAIVCAVDAANKAYYDYRDIHGVTAGTEAKFKSATLKYQEAMKIFKQVYQSELVPESDEVIAFGNELIGLIQRVTKNTKLKKI